MDIRKVFKVDAPSVYFQKKYNLLSGSEEEGNFWNDDKNELEIAFVTKIIATEMAVYIARRATGFNGCNIDALREINEVFILCHKVELGYDFVDYNKVYD